MRVGLRVGHALNHPASLDTATVMCVEDYMFSTLFGKLLGRKSPSGVSVNKFLFPHITCRHARQ